MSLTENEDKDIIRRIHESIDDADSIMLAGHVRPDGDCVGSCIAMYHFIKNHFQKKDIYVYLESLPAYFSRLDPQKNIIRHDLPEGKSFDLFITLDISSKDRLGDALPFFDNAASTVCIDHHISNENFAGINLVKGNICANCEILYDVIGEENIDFEIAQALYVGICTDTGGFRFDETTGRTMEIAGRFVDMGIPFHKLQDECFSISSLEKTKVMGEAMANVEIYEEGRVALTVVTAQMCRRIGVKTEDVEGIAQKMRVIRGVEAGLMFHEYEDNVFKVSLRTNDYVNASDIALTFGGGGHLRAAGFTIRGDIEQCKNAVLDQIRRQL